MTTQQETTPKQLYTLTPEHRAQLKPWADKWIANAMSCEAMTEEDRRVCRDAVNRLYEAADKPRPKSIVFVPSPFVLRFAAGFAAAAWYERGEGKKSPDEQDVADRSENATRIAAWNAVALESGSDKSLLEAVQPTRNVTHVVTAAGTHEATLAKPPSTTCTWWHFDVPQGTKFEMACAQRIYWCWQGGNQWSAYDAYISFFRHIAKLDLDWSKWDAWEILSLHSGPRIVHEHFCMISDRPVELHVDDQNRPHNDKGPFCRWRDGSALYAVHGVRVPAWIIEYPSNITVAEIDAEANAEVRRVMIERYGQARFILDAGAKVIHQDDFGTLYRREMKEDEPIVMVKVVNSTPEPDGSGFRDYWLRVPPTMERARQAVAWTFGVEEQSYELAQQT